MPGPFGPDQQELGPDQTGDSPVGGDTGSGDGTGGGTGTVGSLSDADLTALATRLLDLPNAIETGVTLRMALRVILAEAAGRVETNRESRTWAYLRKDDVRVAVSGEFDADGNRVNIEYGDLT
jgi:hypothetical protein